MDFSATVAQRNVIELSSHVRFYVPSTVSANVQVDTAEIADLVSVRFSEWFGGATRFNALGTWVSPQHGLIKEAVVVVDSYCSEDALNDHAGDVVDLAAEIKDRLKQEAVAIEVNNKLYLI
jgi:hypothetical protein